MKQVVYSKQFLKASLKLPKDIQKKLDALIGVLAGDPFHPLLHSKPLMGRLSQAYSFRVTREWRVIFVFEQGEVIRLLKVGHRKDIYR